MQYKNGPYIAASSGFSVQAGYKTGDHTSKNIDHHLAGQQQWPIYQMQCNNSINKTGLARSSSCVTSITAATVKQANTATNNYTATTNHIGNGLLASWTVNNIDRNCL
jgi:hypothetical protein